MSINKQIFVSYSHPSRSKAQHYESSVRAKEKDIHQYLYEVVHELVSVLSRLMHRVPRLFASAPAAADGRQLGGELLGVEAALGAQTLERQVLAAHAVERIDERRGTLVEERAQRLAPRKRHEHLLLRLVHQRAHVEETAVLLVVFLLLRLLVLF